MDESLEILKNQITNQSPQIRSFVADNFWTSKCKEIAVKYGFTESMTTSLINEVMFVILGFESAEDFSKNIIRNVGINTKIAAYVSDRIDTEIFSKVRDFLPQKVFWYETMSSPTQLKPRIEQQFYSPKISVGNLGGPEKISDGNLTGTQASSKEKTLGRVDEVFSQNMKHEARSMNQGVMPQKTSGPPPNLPTSTHQNFASQNLGGQASNLTRTTFAQQNLNGQAPKVPEEYHQELGSGNMEHKTLNIEEKSELQKKLESNPNVMKSGYSGVDPYREPTD